MRRLSPLACLVAGLIGCVGQLGPDGASLAGAPGAEKGGASGGDQKGGAAGSLTGGKGGEAAATGGSGGGPASSLFAVRLSPLVLRDIDWNPKHADAGVVVAVAEVNDLVVLFGSKGAVVLAAGLLRAIDPSVTAWSSAATIPAADGAGLWAAAVSADGRVYRIHDGQSLDEISDRYGLAGMTVRSLAGMGTASVGFDLGSQLAIADGASVIRYAAGLRSISGAKGRLAGVDPDGGAQMFDGASRTFTPVGVIGARTAAVDADGRVLVATDTALYLASGGAATMVFRGGALPLRGLTAAGGRVWFGVGPELCAVDGSAVSCTSGQSLPPDAVLSGSTTGDIWVLSQGAAHRFAPDASGDEADWRANVLPIYEVSCSACHDQGASSGYEFSSYGEWKAKRQKIYDRVVVKRDMPQGGALSEADRAKLGVWAMSTAP